MAKTYKDGVSFLTDITIHNIFKLRVLLVMISSEVSSTHGSSNMRICIKIHIFLS